ncbi:hypothetical protein D3C81_1846620 [compost metagenome]
MPPISELMRVKSRASTACKRSGLAAISRSKKSRNIGSPGSFSDALAGASSASLFGRGLERGEGRRRSFIEGTLSSCRLIGNGGVIVSCVMVVS